VVPVSKVGVHGLVRLVAWGWLLPAEREPTLIFNLQPMFGVGGDVPFCLDFGKMQIVVCCSQLSNKSILFTGKTEDLLVL
jgi:hypothetical protein